MHDPMIRNAVVELPACMFTHELDIDEFALQVGACLCGRVRTFEATTCERLRLHVSGQPVMGATCRKLAVCLQAWYTQG
jgi:hypothetical protein